MVHVLCTSLLDIQGPRGSRPPFCNIDQRQYRYLNTKYYRYTDIWSRVMQYFKMEAAPVVCSCAPEGIAMKELFGRQLSSLILLPTQTAKWGQSEEWWPPWCRLFWVVLLSCCLSCAQMCEKQVQWGMNTHYQHRRFYIRRTPAGFGKGISGNK